MKHLKSFLIVTGLACVLFTACEKNTTESVNDSATQNSQQNEHLITESDFSNMIAEIQSEYTDNTNFSKTTPVKTVDFVDLSRYTGRWYEIAKYPNPFSIGCTCTTADYALNNDKQSVSVFNNCTIALTDKTNSINGTATVVDSETNAKLKVKFENIPGPGGDYWIIDLITFNKNKPYNFAVVSDPKREGLFILSRTPQLKGIKNYRALFTILRNLHKQDYNLSKIVVSPQLNDCIYP